MVELLAPAGSREALVAAVENGANAIYLAGNAFGARAYASNFDREALREAIHFAHLRKVAIHVTVNTIVADEEMGPLRDYLRFLYEAGADAVLVQDLGVARVAHETVPDLPLHASTQMSVSSLEGVRALAELGFTRVVLARELSLKEIRHICAHAPVEIETFMHGALCVCYSGQCLMSSMIGGRSGNRGRCAQPCRLPYTLVDEKGQDVLGDKAGSYLLSPRDLSTIDVIPDLIEAGVSSLKIEGRMKRPEYVATVVRTYREAIDTYYAGKGYVVTQEERDDLAQIFNRDFTTAYLEGRPGKAMMSDRRPNNRGLLIGRVTAYDWDARIVTVKLSGRLGLGDQVDFWVKVGGRVTATISSLRDAEGREVEEGQAGDTVSFAIPSAVRDHDRVFKVYDARLMERAKETYASGAPVRRIPVAIAVRAAIGEPLTVTLCDAEGHRGEGRTDFIGESARKRPLSEEIIRKQVSRLGTSVYEMKSLHCDIAGEVMVPMSEINEARRKAVEALDALRLKEIEAREHRPEPKFTDRIARPTPKKADFLVAVDTLGKAEAALAAGADGILFGGESYEHRVIAPEEYERAWQMAREAGARIDFNTPRIVHDGQQKHAERLLAAFAAFPPDAVHVHNIAMLALVRRLTDFAIHADYSLISYNKQTLAFLKDYGASGATLSPELTAKEIRQLAKESPLPLTCIVHGRLELMVSNYCVTGSFLGGCGEGPCTQPCTRGHFALKDRKDALFPLAMDQFCHMHVLNSKVLSMMPHAMKFRAAGIETMQIEAKAMGEKEIAAIVKAYRKAMAFPEELAEAQLSWIHEQEGKDITRGHYFRGVL
ncbi:U32 family peptidase [uncultured Mitsuokella sp.]|uniref:U32 family peptidase n=1 Tax=uncultured Mitsuokella sp. TaxID=453120 RepID=UPI002676B05C|nr:U32 family peptidase [uncultured Mitsuokella sp.]